MTSKTNTKSKWKIRKISLADLHPSENNPRQIDERAQKALEASLRRFGYVEPIVWNEKTGKIVGGHQRYRLLVDQGIKEAMVVVVDMSAEDELAANLTLNNPTIEGEWDDPILTLLSGLEEDASDLYKELDFDGLRKAIEAMTPKKGDDSNQDKNREIDVDDLTSDCDTKCPCCGFEWQIDSKDVKVVIDGEDDEDDEGEDDEDGDGEGDDDA
jgi:hypothetical protein